MRRYGVRRKSARSGDQYLALDDRFTHPVGAPLQPFTSCDEAADTNGAMAVLSPGQLGQ